MNRRREEILEKINAQGFMSINDLAVIFPDVSTMTIRRDLEFLEDRGDIVRTKGGAKSIMHLSMQKEEAYHRRELINPDLKREIARKASGLIENNTCVFLDSGSTVMHIAKMLMSKKIFAVTSSPNVAMEMLRNPDCVVSMTGGKLNRENICLSGLGAVHFLDDINIGTAVIAASGYSPDYGFTCGNFDENELKKAAVKSAQRVVIVMDSTKIGRNHPFTFAELSDVDIFVTDSKFDGKLLSDIKKKGVKVL